MCRPKSAGGEDDQAEDGLEEATLSGQGMALENAEEAPGGGTVFEAGTASDTGGETRNF